MGEGTDTHRRVTMSANGWDTPFNTVCVNPSRP